MILIVIMLDYINKHILMLYNIGVCFKPNKYRLIILTGVLSLLSPKIDNLMTLKAISIIHWYKLLYNVKLL